MIPGFQAALLLPLRPAAKCDCETADGEPSDADVVEWLSQKLNIDDDDIEEARPYDHDRYNADAAYEKAQNSLAWDEMHGGGL